MTDRNYRAYWDRNIDRWGELYLDISHGHETFAGPAWYSRLYNASIGRIERREMAERYVRTIAFIDAYVKPGMVFSDLGCGTGIFVVRALQRGAVVNAIDFSPAALEITKQNVLKYCPDGRVTYRQADVQANELPISDVTLAMGLTPYLTDLAGFMERALPKTKLLFCLYVDSQHWANRIRTALPFLNVRRLQCYAKNDIDILYTRHGWTLKDRQLFATGYIDLANS
jgi:SAM-dependent methyltransferase